jgi:integrase
MADAEALADFLGLRAAEQSARASAVHMDVPLRSNVVRLEDVRPDHRDLRIGSRAANVPVDTGDRIRSVASYIEWHLSHRLGDLDRRRQDSEDLSSLGEHVVERLRQRAPRAMDNQDDDVALEGVSPEILALIEEALLPDGPNNPFRSRFVQARNYLIWRLLLDPGARRDEVRNAKVEDIDYSTRRFEITVSKTRPRKVPISAKTAEAFDRFVMDWWAKLPQAARKRRYLFTDERGRHLSPRAVNRLFERVRNEIPGVPDFMSPHTVRRSWNDQFSARVDSIPLERRPPEEEERKMRSRLQGWSAGSTMASRYTKRHIKRKADQIAEQMMEALATPSKGAEVDE